ncbi:HIT domain-containing protein [Ferrimonas lipolytica]|uniref:HIT domain-containing protein n=1 Tax=Ferrimonas lipolytica TaxID=2724191 RepID=A0A6H1U9F9_9GAMM|nr:HIT domain-containing protein [Ferrimonas lipolytica]QIZ75685.1 HIT domain-containing protein [Ferrimonas lipolytica]
MFELNSTLAADSVLLGTLPLCQVRLSRDSQFPWLLLVPMRKDISEIHQLEDTDQQQLIHESCTIAALMEQHVHPDKINVAAIGNMVAQLHLHHVARYHNDPCWPKPIWGQLPPLPYPIEDLKEITKLWQQRLNQLVEFEQA